MRWTLENVTDPSHVVEVGVNKAGRAVLDVTGRAHGAYSTPGASVQLTRDEIEDLIETLTDILEEMPEDE